MKLATLALSALLLSGVSAAQSIHDLFQKAKEEIKAGSWADAQKSLAALDAESSKPGNEVARKQLEAPMAFYGGVCASGLGKTDEAVASFEAFLKLQPNATIDKAVYSKKAVAAFEKAGANRAPSLAEAFKEFQSPADAAERDRADQYWGSGPAQWIMTAQEKTAWSALADPNARVEFVEAFWTAREPDYRRQFEKRVAFADANLAVDAESRGSLTDRGMVFVLLGPPTYAGRKPIRTGDDASDSAGMSTVGSHDESTAIKVARSDPSKKVTSAKLSQLSAQFAGPGKKAPGSSDNRMEVWHYRRELLPKGVPYQQVDCEFVTRTGYGVNVLQREPATLNTLEAARSAGTKPPS